MDWEAIEEGLRLGVAAALTLPDVGTYKPVVWRDTAVSGTSGGWGARPTARVRLNRHASQNQGKDEIVHDYDEDEDALYPSTRGPRRFWVSVKIEIETQVSGQNALALADRLRSRLEWPRVVRLLAAAGVAVEAIRPAVDGSYLGHEGRTVSVAVVDLVCQAAENDTDRNDTGGYFNKVRVSGAPDTDMADVAEVEIGPPD